MSCPPDGHALPVPGEEQVFLTVGGVRATVRAVIEAHWILEDSPGLMVRQPLARYRSPLALCDYHQEAAPYRVQYYSSLACGGRGAAGRPATKLAFMHALRVRSQAAMRQAPLEMARPLIDEAYAAIAEDVSYVLAMVRLATTIEAKQHSWRQRAELRQAQQAAVDHCAAHAGEWSCDNQSACGTGRCPLAQGVYKRVTAVAGSGKAQRPPNHSGGGTYGLESALAQLAELDPFKVASLL